MSLFKKEKLIEYKLEIHGMRCGMCESHINDVIRKNFDIKKGDILPLKEVVASCSMTLMSQA